MDFISKIHAFYLSNFIYVSDEYAMEGGLASLSFCLDAEAYSRAVLLLNGTGHTSSLYLLLLMYPLLDYMQLS